MRVRPFIENSHLVIYTALVETLAEEAGMTSTGNISAISLATELYGQKAIDTLVQFAPEEIPSTYGAGFLARLASGNREYVKSRY